MSCSLAFSVMEDAKEGHLQDAPPKLIIFFYLIEKSKEEVAGDPLIVHVLGVAYDVVVGIQHFTALFNLAQYAAFAIAHRAIGIDVAYAVSCHVIDLQAFHLAHRFVGLVAHCTVVVEEPHRQGIGVTHNAVGRDATYVVIVGVAQRLCLCSCHEQCG